MSRWIASLALLTCAALAQAASEGPAALTPGLENPGHQAHPSWFKESFLDIREDVAEASAAGKRLILYFHQDGCPYCAKLLRDNLGDRDIAGRMREHFDVIAINLWGDREVTDLAGGVTTEKAFGAALGVQFTPTLLMLDESGGVVLRINGYFPPQRFRAALDYVAERRERSGARFSDDLAAPSPAEAKGGPREEGGFLPKPLRLADNRAASRRPLLVMFEQPLCADCDELHQDILRQESVALSLTAFDAAIVDSQSTDIAQLPDGRERSIRDWAAELGIHYTPSLVFFDAGGREVFRTEGYLKRFHIQGALDYVATGAYHWQPSFQRFLSARRAALAERGIRVDLMD